MRKVQLVRLVCSCLALLISVVFCHQFSIFQLQNFLYGAGFPASHLPLACRWLAAHSTWLLLLPPVVLLVGSRRLLAERSESVFVEVLAQSTWLLAAALVLGCILVWQVPYIVPTGELL